MIAALLLSVAASSSQVARALERLSAPIAEERAAAQRELTWRLVPGDLDLLRDHARAAPVEVRRRLVFALADSDRHLGLAAALACDADGRLAALGRDAIAEMIARWSEGYARIGIGRSETLAKLGERNAPPLVFDRRLARDPESALDLLARALPGVPPCVLDPEMSVAERDVEPVEGTFERALGELLRAHELDLEGLGFDADLDQRARPWVRVARRGSQAQRTGTDHLVEWCAGAACAGDPRRRAACARALAASGWPAATLWLESRWLAERDESALDGLLIAAGRGRVARALTRGEVHGDLHARMRAAAGERTRAGDLRAERIARALGAAGSSGERGEELGPLASQGWSSFSARDTWLALVVLEAQGRPSTGDLARCGALLGDLSRAQAWLPPAVSALDPHAPAAAALRLQALRVLSLAGSSPAPQSGHGTLDARAARGWLASAERSGVLDETVRRLVDSGVAPPADLCATPGDAPTSAAPRRAALEWSLFRGSLDTAAGDLLSVIAGSADPGREIEALAARCLPRVRAGSVGRLEALVRRARGIANEREPARAPELLGSFAALAGAREEGADALASALAPERRDRESLLVLGAFAATARGGEARAALVRALAGPAEVDDAIAALDRAVTELRAARMEAEERVFVSAVRAAARDADPERRARLRVDAWPAAPSPEPIVLGALDRTLGRAGL